MILVTYVLLMVLLLFLFCSILIPLVFSLDVTGAMRLSPDGRCMWLGESAAKEPDVDLDI